MFGFGSISSFFFGDEHNPVEPFSEDEFVTHNDRELKNLDAGRDSHCDSSTPLPDFVTYIRDQTNFGK